MDDINDVTLMETVEAVQHDEALVSATEVNTSFSKIWPHLQLAHDSSSIKAGEKCWQFYKYYIIDGYAPIEFEDNPHLKFGTLFHSASELYDHLRYDIEPQRKCETCGMAEGGQWDHETALRGAVRIALINSWDWVLKRPWISSEPTKTRTTLVQTLIAYLDKFQADHMETLMLMNGKPAVELSFRINLNDLVEDGSFRAPTGEEYVLCGHLDKAARFNGELFIPDKKTSKYQLDDTYFNQFTPDSQISIYTIAGNVIFDDTFSGVLIDAAQILVGGTRLRRAPIHRTPEQLEEWILNFKIYLSELERNVQMNHWPQRPSACGWGHMQCMYRKVCSADPSVREDILENFFAKRPRWDPLIPR